MKKKYTTPYIEITCIEAQTIMAASMPPAYDEAVINDDGALEVDVCSKGHGGFGWDEDE